MVEKKKFSFFIKRVKPEKNPDGVALLRLTLKTAKAEYTKGVTLKDWGNPQTQRSFKEGWLKELKALEEQAEISEDELDAKAKAIEGEVIEDE